VIVLGRKQPSARSVSLTEGAVGVMGTPGPSGFSVAQSAQLLMPRASFSVEGAWGAYVGSGRIVARLIVETARGRLLDTPTRDLPQRSGAGGRHDQLHQKQKYARRSALRLRKKCR
jgi:hypothetical protein